MGRLDLGNVCIDTALLMVADFAQWTAKIITNDPSLLHIKVQVGAPMTLSARSGKGNPTYCFPISVFSNPCR